MLFPLDFTSSGHCRTSLASFGTPQKLRVSYNRKPLKHFVSLRSRPPSQPLAKAFARFGGHCHQIGQHGAPIASRPPPPLCLTPMILHRSQTILAAIREFFWFETPMILHRSQTLYPHFGIIPLFETPMILHRSQTLYRRFRRLGWFETPMILHRSQTLGNHYHSRISLRPL